MITYRAIVKQIEKRAFEAGQSTNEQQIREQLAAIRALCDVVLDEQSPTSIGPTQTVTSNYVNHSTTSPIFAQAQPVVNVSQKLEEEDANGDSIFDF